MNNIKHSIDLAKGFVYSLMIVTEHKTRVESNEFTLNATTEEIKKYIDNKKAEDERQFYFYLGSFVTTMISLAESTNLDEEMYKTLMDEFLEFCDSTVFLN